LAQLCDEHLFLILLQHFQLHLFIVQLPLYPFSIDLNQWRQAILACHHKSLISYLLTLNLYRQDLICFRDLQNLWLTIQHYGYDHYVIPFMNVDLYDLQLKTCHMFQISFCDLSSKCIFYRSLVILNHLLKIRTLDHIYLRDV